MIVEAGKTYIRRLRAVSASRDALALRMSLERTLSQASLHPSWLPPTAILCVRSLRGEGAAASSSTNGRRGARPRWEREIAARIETLARRAARPAREAVAEGAEAVIFDDQAELLACLASDWCGGVETTRWWWQSLFGVREVSAALLPALLASPEHVPAALENLSRAGSLSAFARALGGQEAREIRRRVTRKFALRALEDVLERPGQAAGQTEPERGFDGGRSEEGGESRHSARAPWELFVPQVRFEELGDEQSCLIGASLMLLRAPSLVRSNAFAEVVSRWRLGEQASSESGTSSAPNADGLARTDRLTHGTRRDSGEALGRAARVETDARPKTVEGDAHTRPAAPAAPKEFIPSVVADADGQGGVEDLAGSVETRSAGRDSQDAEVFSTLNRESERATEAVTTNVPQMCAQDGTRASLVFNGSHVYEARVETEFGGVFYLTNLALFLELYGDFTTPLARGIELPLWDFLALVGDGLCGERVRRDPVWALLGELSGREETEEPGAGFEPPGDWRVPPGWLAAFPTRGVWKWKTEDGRLLVRHPHGFLILDVPASDDTRTQLEAEASPYPLHLRGPLRRASFETACGAAGTVERWRGRLLPYVRARLGRALGVRGRGALGRLVCEHRAKVSVTATRLDVKFALAGLPLEVRLAGLDRDPGWVPAAGRHVAFHYE